LLGGDTVRVFGNGAVDGDQNAWGGGGVHQNEPTTLHTAVIAGVVGPDTGPVGTPRRGVDVSGAVYPGEPGNGLWLGGDLTIVGSVAVTHLPVFGPIPTMYDGDGPDTGPWGNGTYQPDHVRIIFDHRMASLDRQPPGAVTLSVAATRAWER